MRVRCSVAFLGRGTGEARNEWRRDCGRLLHREPDGSLTWRLRGETVPATRATDVRLNIDPAAESAA